VKVVWIHANGQTDGYDKTKSRFSNAIAPKNSCMYLNNMRWKHRPGGWW